MPLLFFFSFLHTQKKKLLVKQYSIICGVNSWVRLCNNIAAIKMRKINKVKMHVNPSLDPDEADQGAMCGRFLQSFMFG